MEKGCSRVVVILSDSHDAQSGVPGKSALGKLSRVPKVSNSTDSAHHTTFPRLDYAQQHKHIFPPFIGWPHLLLLIGFMWAMTHGPGVRVSSHLHAPASGIWEIGDGPCITYRTNAYLPSLASCLYLYQRIRYL